MLSHLNYLVTLMSNRVIIVPQLELTINTLLDAAGDKDESVRDSVSSSLRRLAKKYAVHVLQSAVAYRQKNPKLNSVHLATILTTMERICDEQTDDIDELTVKQLVTYCVDEMTKCSEYLPNIQFPVSNMLVSLGQKHCSDVISGLIQKLEANTVPHYTVMHTMANLASANIPEFVPFIKSVLDLMLPLLPTIRNDPIRQVFSFALGRFSEAVLEYLSTEKLKEDGQLGDIVPSVTREAFTDGITAAYEILLTSWLQAKESKITENVIIAVGPMFPLVCEDKQPEYATKTITVLLNMYKRSQSSNHFPITQCLASILQAAPSQAIEPLYDQLISVLGHMVVVSPDYTNPQTVKNHSEVLRCYDKLGGHFPQRTADLLVRQLSSGSEKERVEALIVAAHLLSGSENVLQPRVQDITAALRLLLTCNSVRIKKALLKTIVSLACRGNAEDGSDFVEFLVRHCCPNPNFSGPEWEELRAMCSSTVYLLSTTVAEVESLLWSVLLRLLLIPEYDPACATMARSLAHLAVKRNNQMVTKNGGGIPSPPAVFARCLALLGSPLNNNRGPYLLNFLQHYCPHLQPSLAKIWDHKIPQLVNYLEVSEWSESEWEALVLEFVSSSLQTVVAAEESEDWVILVAGQLSAQIPLYPPSATDERAMLLKCLALAACNLSDRQIVSSHLDVMLAPLRNYSPHDSKACARGVGLLSRVHLSLVLSRLDSVSQSELNRRSSRLLGLMKDTRADLEVERARITLLRCYAEVANQAPPSALLPCLEDGLMNWLISQLNLTKDPAAREATLHTIANIADTLDRHRDTYSENLKSRDLLLNTLLSLINSSSPDPLLLKVTAAVVKLPPEITTEFRSKLLCSCFDRVFAAENGENNAEEKPPDCNPIIKNLGLLVEELLIDDISPATLDDISTMLEPWLIQRNVQQRSAAVYILRITLQAYYHHMTFGYENPSKFNQAGVLMGRAVLRCLDEDTQVQACARECARLILLISAKYEGQSISDSELEAAFASMNTNSASVNEQLAKVVAGKLPHYQLNHFADTVLQGLSDLEPANVEAVCDILVHFFQAKGGELYHHINDILALLLTRLAALNPTSRTGAVRTLLPLAKHHPKAMVNTLLAQPLPWHLSVCDSWKALAADQSMAADITDQFLRLINTSALLNEDAATTGDRPRVAALLPFAAISAFKEMFLVASMYDLASAHFADLFALLLTVVAAYVGVTPPIYAPGTNKTMFIPNREAYKINPAKVAQDCFKNFLLCARCDAAAEAVLECSQIDLGSNNIDYFLAMIPALARAVCESWGHLLPKILTALGQYNDSTLEAQRAAVTAFNVECIQLQCAGQTVLIDSVLSNLLASLTDPSALVRRLSLKGLANISYLDVSPCIQLQCAGQTVLIDSVLSNLLASLTDPSALCIQLQCAGQTVLIDSVLSNLLASLTDPSALVRRLSLKGLANISYLDVSPCIQLQCAGQTVLIDSVLSNLLASLTDPSALVRRLSLKGLANISYLDVSPCIQLQCAGQSVLIDSVLSNLLASLTDPSALVRRLSLKGLANISYLDVSPCIQLQCAGQSVLIDSVLSNLLASLTDPSALVRRLSLKGLANISYLDVSPCIQLQCAGQTVLIDSVLSNLLASLTDPSALVRRLSLKGLANISYLDVSPCIQLQCAGQTVLIDSVLSNLLASLTDPSALVRRLSLKGLANISYLDEQQLAYWNHCVVRERHCESILEALIQGLDDHDAECHGDVALQAMVGLSQVLPTIQQAHVRDIQVAVALRVKPFFEKENIELRTMSLRLLGELAVSGGSALPGFQEQVKACLVCLLMHLCDSEPSVVKACKFSLRAVSNILEAEKTKAMMNQHLIDDATLYYQDFFLGLAKLLVEEMTDQIPVMITTALSYGKSSWPSIRAGSALFIGALYSNSPSYVRERVALETITMRLLQQVKDPEREVRSSAAYAFSLLFTSPS
ncbi:maestro heat-like repeat-containing protein family member 1 [Macrosteles quadrilineatus]|uniref:maestro heat-like repeat-containing protein family member 1 n=1 Tax=Macrosteles quadrilineatus TaxID=74068 RepID=UPI0023E11380|nr:maestro heat-like repeat-containing protein family member 1 [Macrosteles quadrilineatus]